VQLLITTWTRNTLLQQVSYMHITETGLTYNLYTPSLQVFVTPCKGL
jgi:hypothetical protein